MPPIASFETPNPIYYQLKAESRHIVQWTQSTNNLSDSTVVKDFFTKSIGVLDKTHKLIRSKYPKLFNR